MRNKKNDLSERLLNFAANTIKLLTQLNKSAVGRRIGDQLLRSATSSGANYEEANGAESHADFIHKMQIVLKELKESVYWLKLIRKVDLVSNENLQALLNEADELVRIIAKSVITAKARNK